MSAVYKKSCRILRLAGNEQIFKEIENEFKF